MNEKAFIRRAQKLTAMALQTKKSIKCQIQRLDGGRLNFCITHFDKRYGTDGSPFNNHSINVYTHGNDDCFYEAWSFINRILSGEDALIGY